MAFLAPLFLLGLGALAIPVLIHLIQREKKQIQPFPSLMFVRRVPYKSVRRRRVHNWLLLLVRLAALALIVAAFARPFLRRQDVAAAAGAGAREVVVLLDQSYSMGSGDRWDRARQAARDAIGRVGPSDRASVVLFGSTAEIVVRSTPERARLLGGIPSTPPSPAGTRYAPALKVAGSILAESLLPRREVILISDFQRGGWRGEEGARLPAGTVLTPVAVGGAAGGTNVAVTAVSLARSSFSNQERVAVTAAVANRGLAAVAGGEISLEMGGRVVETAKLDVPAEGATTVTFMPFYVTARNMRGTVRVGMDALPADNAFNFVVSPAAPVRVTLVDRGGSGGLYLSRALAIGDAPAFQTVVRQPDTLTDEDLRTSAVVVLNDAVVAPGLGRRLERFVQQGGGLFVAAGPRATWPQDADILPATITSVVDRTRGEPARLGSLEYASPVFEPFRAPRSGDFSTVRVYGYRNVTPSPKGQVLARFDGGAPAVLERRVGTGRVLLFASTLDLSWSDLPLKPIYLPFVRRAIEHVASWSPSPAWLTIGQVLDPTIVNRGAAGRVALTPSGRRVGVDDEGGEVLMIEEQGFYEVRGPAGRAGDATAVVVASNVDPAESDLTEMDPKDIVAAATGGDPAAGGRVAAAPMTPEAQERSQQVWWYLLCLGLALLAVDTVLSNRLSKA